MAGLLGNFKNPLASGGLLSDPMVRLQMGAAMMGGQTLGQQIGGGLQAAGVAKQAQQEAAKRNQTVEWLKTINPELAQAVEMGALSGGDAYKMAIEAQTPKTPDFQEVGGQLFNPATQEWISPPVNPNAPPAMPKVGMQPILMRDKKTGQVVVGQLNDANQLNPSQVPDGYEAIGPYDKAFDTSKGKELGAFAGNQEATAEKDVSAADTALDVLNQIEKHPYLDRGVGGTSMFNAIPGTGGKDFQSLVDQAKGGAFLQAIQQMRGLGALSNTEGTAATAAITSMDTATSKEQFLSALATYRTIVEGAKKRALARMPAGPLAAPPPGASGGASIEELLQKY